MCLLAFDCTRFYPRLSGYPNADEGFLRNEEVFFFV